MNFSKFKDSTCLMYGVHLVNWYYLAQRGKRDHFTDVEFFDACSQLSRMIGMPRNITALLAKLYAEQLIATKERKDANELPNNIPNLNIVLYK